MPTDLAMVSPDDQVTAEGENLVRTAINELRAMTVDAGTMELTWNGGTPCFRVFTQLLVRWFYTTSAITTATASATGTAVGAATMTDGSGTARPCIETGTGASIARTPDANSQDVTIYNPAVYTTQIAVGSFVRCVWANSRWEVEFVIRCPGS